ncbi:acyl-CoA thioesterase, partial [Kingella kingae]|nr:acyl-CoA thioesterase [Kingella kingae]
MIAKQPAPLIISVLNYHLDGYAHVNNARYLEFLEAARWHFFAEHNLLPDLRLAQLVVSRTDIPVSYT